MKAKLNRVIYQRKLTSNHANGVEQARKEIYFRQIKDLCKALARPGESILLSELHTHLLRNLLAAVSQLREVQLAPPQTETAMPLQQVPYPNVLTPTTWPEVLRCSGWLLAELHPNQECEAALESCEA